MHITTNWKPMHHKSANVPNLNVPEEGRPVIGYTCQCVCVCVWQQEHKCVLVCIDAIVSSVVRERRRGTEHHVKQQLGQPAAFTTREWTQPAIPVTANHASTATQSSQTRCKHITSTFLPHGNQPHFRFATPCLCSGLLIVLAATVCCCS